MNRCVALIVSCLFAVSLLPAQGKKPLTNDSIVYMVTAGLEEAVVIKAIAANDSAFDTSAEGLLALKKAGVSETITQAMLKSNAPSASTSVRELVVTPPKVEAAPAEALPARARPNFTGRWKFDKAQSVIRVSKGKLPKIEEMALSIDHQDPRLTVVMVVRAQKQAEATRTFNYATDGTETENDLGNGGRFTSRHQWQGRVLAGKAKYLFQPARGSSAEGEGTGSMSLSEDGRTLVTDSHLKVRKVEIWERAVYIKQ